jgi:hypothetical protein
MRKHGLHAKTLGTVFNYQSAVPLASYVDLNAWMLVSHLDLSVCALRLRSPFSRLGIGFLGSMKVCSHVAAFTLELIDLFCGLGSGFLGSIKAFSHVFVFAL